MPASSDLSKESTYLPDNTYLQLGRSQRALKNLFYFLCGGLFIIVMFAFQSSSISQFFSVVGVSFLIAGSFFSLGGLIGFLFGIPRTLQQESLQLAEITSDDTTSRKGSHGSNLYQENTNLEQISDWLSKILVGVGLTQLTRVPAALEQYSVVVNPALGGFPGSSTFGIAILIFFSVDGFLIGYLWTRRYAAVEFRKGISELQIVTSELGKVETRLTEVEKQVRIDSEAIRLVQRVLNPPPGTPSVKQEELNAKIAVASKAARSHIFYNAMIARKQNRLRDENKPAMERTIPIFRALIANDTKNVYHANHGQLGFALKDKREPIDWSGADSELTEAIKIRGSWKRQGGLIYEFNRAICRIHLDDGFYQNKSATFEVRESIIKDISAAANDLELCEIMSENKDISKWMNLNNLNISDFIPSDPAMK